MGALGGASVCVLLLSLVASVNCVVASSQGLGKLLMSRKESCPLFPRRTPLLPSRLMAKDMLRLENKYNDRLNFVVIDGDDPQNAPIVRAFAVDGIPHFAFISPERKLAATLVGQVPDKVMQRQLEAFAVRGALPYGT